MSDTKKRLNITGRCYIKQNKADGAILSFLTDVPVQADSADLLFILTVPGEGQKYAPAYCRLQDKPKNADDVGSFDSFEELDEIRDVGHLKETKKGRIVVCAPREHRKVWLDKVVVIATIPADGKNAAPCYIRRKAFDKSRDELKETIKTATVGQVIMEVEEEEIIYPIPNKLIPIEEIKAVNAELT